MQKRLAGLRGWTERQRGRALGGALPRFVRREGGLAELNKRGAGFAVDRVNMGNARETEQENGPRGARPSENSRRDSSVNVTAVAHANNPNDMTP